MLFQGALTALVTPFTNDGIDLDSFRALVRRQIEGGINGLVPCGTTGEAPTLTADETDAVVSATIEEATGRVPVLAGIGSNSTAVAVANAKRLERLGVDGVLGTAPYYKKPTQEGLYQHFKAIAESISVEVCLYDVPGRSVVRILPDTVARLAEIENITTLKDATGDLANLTEVRRRCGDSLSLLSGDDFTTLPFIATGGHGAISVASNVAPDQVSALIAEARAGDLASARARHERLFPLFNALFVESNPIPVKAALGAMGLLNPTMRLPLCPISDAALNEMERVLQDLQLI